MADKVFVHVCAVVAQFLSGPCMCVRGMSRQRDAGAGACGRLPAWIIACMIKKSQEVIASLLISHYPCPLYVSCVSGWEGWARRWKSEIAYGRYGTSPAFNCGTSSVYFPSQSLKLPPLNKHILCNGAAHTFGVHSLPCCECCLQKWLIKWFYFLASATQHLISPVPTMATSQALLPGLKAKAWFELHSTDNRQR